MWFPNLMKAAGAEFVHRRATVARDINFLTRLSTEGTPQRPTSGIQAHSSSFPRAAGEGHLPSNAIGGETMNFLISALVAIAAFVTGGVFDSAPAQAQFTQQGPKLVGCNA